MSDNKTDQGNWLDLTDRTCVVTGAGSGIGAGVARTLARLGARVAVLDINAAAAATVASDISQSGGRALGLSVDVTQEDALKIAEARIDHDLGPCAVLVNSAALVSGSTGDLLSGDLALWNRMLSVNLTGALICARVFGQRMVSAGRGGSIINISSICGHLPRPHGGAYSVSKAGLAMLSRMLTLELADHQIRCNCVSPAWVRTPASEPMYSDPDLLARRERMVPSGRISDPSDIADLVAFLASDRSSYINGQDILVDGGLSQILMGLAPRAEPKPDDAKVASGGTA